MLCYDAIVIGAGAVGSAVAYSLQKAGLKTALLDRNDICSGTSGACDGNMLAVTKQPGPAVDLTVAGINRFIEFNAETPEEFSFHQRGSTLVCEDDFDVTFCRELLQRQLDYKMPVRWLDSKELHEREPYLADDIVGAIECDIDASLNPMHVTYALAKNAKRLGCDVRNYHEVTDILINQSGAIAGVETVKGKMLAPQVIICTGAYSAAVGKLANIEIPIIPRKGHILVTENIPQIARRKVSEAKYVALRYQKEGATVDPLIEKMGISLVVEPVEEGYCLLGSSREFVGFDTKTSPLTVELIARRVMRFFPIMKNLHIVRTYAGLRPYTEDHLPLVGPVSAIPGLYIAAGHEGEGIGMSLITGAIISHYLCNTPIEVEIESLKPDRFAGIRNPA